MKQALYWKKLKESVQCQLCPRYCVIKQGEFGDCGARKNISGKLYSMVYARPTSVAVDPIEKKPLYHFIPGHRSFSIGTAGCNLHCRHCQNWEISQARAGELPEIDMAPEEVVKEAVREDCKSIAFTYNEPTVFYEYCLDTAKIAHKKGIKTVIVSNGFINKEPLEAISPYIDAANIDLKAFDNKFYRKVTGAWVEPVLECLKILRKRKVWVEITTLIIPTLNDDMKKIEEMCKWVEKELGRDVPLHFTAFYPQYKMLELPATPAEIIDRAAEIGRKYLDYVYTGNLMREDNTVCPECNKVVIRRVGFNVVENKLKEGKCGCGNKIAGVWK